MVDKIQIYDQTNPWAIPEDGWMPFDAVSAGAVAPYAITRTGDNQFTFSHSDNLYLQKYYHKGIRLRWTQNSLGDYKYGVIASGSAVSSGGGYNFTINTIPNSDYVFTAGQSITDMWYSPIELPYQFPDWFNYPVSPTNFQGTANGRWKSGVSGIIDVEIELFATGSVSGNVTLSLPTGHVRQTSTPVLGVGYFLETTVASYPAQVLAISATTCRPIAMNASATYATQSFMAAAVPFTWANGDFAQFYLRYPY